MHGSASELAPALCLYMVCANIGSGMVSRIGTGILLPGCLISDSLSRTCPIGW
jgi:hypothetical protein